MLVGKNEERRLLRRYNRRYEDNIKLYFKEIECEIVDWINLFQDRGRWRGFVNAVVNFPFP
jgi:hypothetical protein